MKVTSIFRRVITVASEFLFRAFFSNELDVMDRDVAILLNKKETAEQYAKAIEDVRSGNRESVTIQVTDCRSITIIK